MLPIIRSLLSTSVLCILNYVKKFELSSDIISLTANIENSGSLSVSSVTLIETSVTPSPGINFAMFSESCSVALKL